MSRQDWAQLWGVGYGDGGSVGVGLWVMGMGALGRGGVWDMGMGVMG